MSQRRTFRLLVGLVAAGLTVSLATAAVGGAAKAPSPSGGAQIQASYYTPMSLRTDTVTAIVELSGDPIAEVQAAQPATPLTSSQKSQIRAQLLASQNAIKPAIQAAGGVVRSDYQNAYNGISIRIARNKLSALRDAARRRGRPHHEADAAVEREQRSVPRRPGGVEHAVLLARPQPEGRDHRHGHRLHARELPLPGHGCDVGRVRRSRRSRHAAGQSGALRSCRREGQGRRRPRRRRLQRERPGRRSGARSASRPEPARLQRPRLARGGHRSRLRRPGEREHVRRPVRRDDAHAQPVPRRAGRRTQGQPVRRPGLRLRGLDRHDGRRDRVVARQRHERDQHVARLIVRPPERPVGGRGARTPRRREWSS